MNKIAQIRSASKFVALFNFAVVLNCVQKIMAKFATFLYSPQNCANQDSKDSYNTCYSTSIIIRTTVAFIEAVATVVVMVTHPRFRYTAMTRWTLDHVRRTVAL